MAHAQAPPCILMGPCLQGRSVFARCDSLTGGAGTGIGRPLPPLSPPRWVTLSLAKEPVPYFLSSVFCFVMLIWKKQN